MSDGILLNILENNFVSYVHQCSLSTQIEYDHPFTYNIIDSDTQNTYFEKDFEIILKNPHDVLSTVSRVKGQLNLFIFLIGLKSRRKLMKDLK